MIMDDTEVHNDNGRRFLEQYGLTDNTVSSLNLFLQGYKAGPEGAQFLAKGLVSNWSLTSLELRKQELGADGAALIGQALKQNRALRHLGLGRNKLCNEGCISIVEALHLNQTLEYLDMEWNEIRDDGAVAIGAMLKRNNSLQSLILERNKIKSPGALALADALRYNERLRNLNIGYNKVMSPGAMAFAEALRVNGTLITLNMYMNEIRSDGVVPLAAALKGNTGLQSLNLQSNRLADGVSAFGDSLKDNRTLRELNLQNTLIDMETAQVLSFGLLNNQSLMSLNISHNQLGTKGLKSVLAALKGKNALRYLDISDTGLADAVEDMCELVDLGGNLQVLQLDDNQIGKKGVVQLCMRLERNGVLHSLNLDRTQMGREGAIALSVVLHKKSYWLALSCAGNNIGNDGIKHICLSLKGLNTLRELDLSENDITNVCDDALFAVLKANPELPFIRLKGNDIARDLPSGVLTRALAEQMMGLDGTLTTAEPDVDIPADLESASFLPPVAPHEKAANRKQSFEPSENFATHKRHPSTSRETPTAVFLPKSAFLQAARPFSPATTLSSAAPSPLPRALSPSLASPQRLLRAGVSPTSFTGVLSPVKSTHTTPQLRRLETNIGGLAITEDQLRRKFNQLDVNGNGYLDRNEFKSMFSQLENYGVQYTQRNIDSLINKHAMWSDDKITFEEFCILMLGVAQR
eukprot:TRINITY_DN2778_c0_g1_i1.p1 TRINITY_DN2778_c0_g1~~TRINITY_DN2778_c0_g1_i1.p1  ORF type:complete len:694 (-),score=121.13 TRINITY_DN2778_c0_g1_i1:38-2119(-)